MHYLHISAGRAAAAAARWTVAEGVSNLQGRGRDAGGITGKQKESADQEHVCIADVVF